MSFKKIKSPKYSVFIFNPEIEDWTSTRVIMNQFIIYTLKNKENFMHSTSETHVSGTHSSS